MSEEVKYTEEEMFQILQTGLQPIGQFANDTVLNHSKYVKLASDYNYENYRLCTVADLSRLGLLSSMSEYRKRFFKENGSMVAIFNEINGKIMSIIFRATQSKAFMDYSLIYTFYGLDLIPEDFKYGDWIVLCEGIYDADSLRHIYPNTIAMLTSNVSVYQAEILKTLTNHFIVCFDSDDAGERGFNTAVKRLPDVQRLDVYKGDKDVGVMEEKHYSGDLEGFHAREEYYREQIDDLRKGVFSL